MSVTLESFRTKFPEFASSADFSDDFLDERIQEASRQINRSFFGARADDAHHYLAAHFAKVIPTSAETTASAQAKKSMTVGPVSITYADGLSSGSLGDFDSTIYGQQYKRILSLYPTAMAVL